MAQRALFPHIFRDTSTGSLLVEKVDVSALAGKYGTPLYVYSKSAILDSFRRYATAFTKLKPLICVSVKANANLSLLNLLHSEGSGFDIVSGGELARVLHAGGVPRSIVFSGVGKTDEEIGAALEAGILMFNVESQGELERINHLAGLREVKAPIAIRVNPDVDPKTHPYISTGMSEHKFGIPIGDALELYRAASRLPNISLRGVSCHIGSMITDLSVFGEAFASLRSFVEAARAYAPELEYLDVGGGLAARYEAEQVPQTKDYAEVAERALAGLNVRLILEPGRSIFAEAGILVSKIIYTKEHDQRRFLIVDAGMNDLIRPALYGAYHHIEPVHDEINQKTMKADIVGPICESGDTFATQREIREMRSGEYVAFFSAGAYGMSMSSNYNARPRAAEMLVDGSDVRVVRERERFTDLYAHEESGLKAGR